MTDLIQLLKDRLTSPFFSTYLFSRLVINRTFIYAILFLDQNLLFQREKLLKTEYLTNLFYNHEFITKYLLIKLNIWIKLLSITYRFMIPLIVVFLIYYIINKIEIFVYELDQNQKALKRLIKYDKEWQLLDKKTINLLKENEISQLSMEIKIIKECKPIINEFDALEISNWDGSISFWMAMKAIKENIRLWLNAKPTNRTKQQIINFFENKWIIVLFDNNNCVLTEKWKIFTRWYDKKTKLNDL